MNRHSLKTCVLLPVLLVLLLPGRLPARELTLVIFDFDVHAGEDLAYVRAALPSLLRSRVAVPGTISPKLPPPGIQKPGTASPDDRLQLARQLEADYFLSGSITKIGDTVSIDARLVDVTAADDPVPLYLQGTDMDSIIPGLETFAGDIRTTMLQGPPLPDHAKETGIAPAPARKPPEPSPSPPAVRETPLVEEPAAPPLPQQAPRPAPAPVPPAAALFAPAPFLTHDISTAPLHRITTGDVVGDEAPEVLVAGNDQILIYRVDAKALVPAGEIRAGAEENILSVEALDLNGNGRAEIYATSYEGHHANSFIVEHDGTTFKRREETYRWFFRQVPGMDSAALLGQKTDLESPFSGQVFSFAWAKDGLVSREEVVLPGGFGLYGFCPADIDLDGQKDYIAFQKGFFSARYRLHIVSCTGRIKWQDPQDLGGSPNTFIRLMYGDDIEQKEYRPMRVICDDLDGDGRSECIVARNSKKAGGLLSRLVDFNQGEVLCLQWDGSDLVQNWSTGQIETHVADYCLCDLNGDGARELLVLTMVKENLLGTAVNRVSCYRLQLP